MYPKVKRLSDLPSRIRQEVEKLPPADRLAGGRGYWEAGPGGKDPSSATAVAKQIRLFNNTRILGVVENWEGARFGREFVLWSTSYDAKGIARDLGMNVRRIDDEKSVWVASAPKPTTFEASVQSPLELAKQAAQHLRRQAGIQGSPVREAAAADEWLVLDRILTSWANRLERKLSTTDVPVKVRLHSEGIKNSRLHPLWNISISYYYDEVEPTTVGLEVSGDAQHPDEVLLEYGRYDHTTGRTYNTRSKELYDWTPRDVIAVLERWL